MAGTDSSMNANIEQFIINVLGLSILALVGYVLMIFSPYIGPVLLAGLLSIPFRQLQADSVAFFAKSTPDKIGLCFTPEALVSILAVMMISHASFGVFGLLFILAMLTIMTRSDGAYLKQPKAFITFALSLAAAFSTLVCYRGSQEIFGGVERILKARHSIEYASILDTVFEHADDLAKRFMATDLVGLAQMVFCHLNIKTMAPDSVDATAHDKISYIMLNFMKVRESSSFNELVGKVKASIAPEHATRMVGAVLRLLRMVVMWLHSSTDFLLQTVTFLSFLYLLMEKSISADTLISGSYKEWRGPLRRVYRELAQSLTMIVRDTLAKLWLQLVGTYLIYTMMGSQFGTVLGITAGLLASLPILPPISVVMLGSLELYLSGRWMRSICLVFLHFLYSMQMVPEVRISVSSRSRYFSNLSILVGTLTFGGKGVLLGPMLGSLPEIGYRLLRGTSDDVPRQEQ